MTSLIANPTAANPTAADALFALATSSGVLFAGRQSGLYRSSDAGQTWVNAFASLPLETPLTVTALAVHQTTIFAGVTGAIVCSYDAGQSWNIVGLALPAPHVMALAFSPNYDEDGTALAATANDGVFVSGDRGATWVAWNFGLIDAHVYSLAFSPAYSRDNVILAGTETGLFRSHNGGRGWYETDFPVESAPVISLSTHGSVLYAGTEANGLLKSIDAGLHWQPVTNPLFSSAVNAAMQHPLSSSVWLLLEEKLVHTTDGMDWVEAGIALPSAVLPMALAPHPTDSAAVVVGLADGSVIIAR